jgi:hypothetical protein
MQIHTSSFGNECPSAQTQSPVGDCGNAGHSRACVRPGRRDLPELGVRLAYPRFPSWWGRSALFVDGVAGLAKGLLGRRGPAGAAEHGGLQLHDALKIGDTVRASAPINNFGLHTGNTPAILLAGGIGSTPILSMAAELQARGTPYRLPMQGARRRVSRFCCSSARLARMPSLSTMTAMSRGWISRPRSTAPPARSTSISADRQG